MAGGETEKQSDLIYAILLGFSFLGFMFFIITLNFWETLSYSIFKLDYKIAGVINYYFSDCFVDYRKIDNLVEIANIPKFNFWKFEFEYAVGNNIVEEINEFYKSLHYIYAITIAFIGYFLINNFKLMPEFRFQNNMRYKLSLVEEAKKRIKIKNKQIKLYDHMDVLLERKRTPANLGSKRQFLNADYYVPFIYEEETSDANPLNIDTNKVYINDSIFYSQHYINNYFKYILEKDTKETKDKLETNNTIYSLKKFHDFFKVLEDKVYKNKNLQDIYYLNMLKLYNEKNKNNFINLFLLETKDMNESKYLITFNNFLKKYKMNDIQFHKLLHINLKNDCKLQYVSYTNEDIDNYNEMETFIFISEKDEKFRLNLEEVYVYFKIINYSYSLNKSYFFNSEEEKVQAPIKNIPPSLIEDISTAEKDDIYEIEKVLDELKSYKERFESLSILEQHISDYQAFKTQYNNITKTIKLKYNEYIKGLIDKEFEFNSYKYKISNLLNDEKNSYDEKYFLENLIIVSEEIDVIKYLKDLKKFIQSLNIVYNKIINNEQLKEDNIEGIDYKKDIEDLKNIYQSLLYRVKALFEEKEQMNYFDIKKKYFDLINTELNKFIKKMLMSVELYYKFKLEYDLNNENSIFPEIGQPIMPSCYILTPFNFKVEKDVLYFNKIKDFQVNGYKKYILPVFEQIYRNWYGNINDLVNYYEKEIDNNSSNLDIDPEEQLEIELKFELLKREAEKQKKSNSSIETKLLKIFQIHKFEETIVIAIWKEFTKLENLPATKLSNLKYDNFVLWYALTSIGDVDNTEKTKVIGRPFDFNAGLPILIMYELEINEYKESLDIKNKAHNLGEH